jgi:hypothetical protein
MHGFYRTSSGHCPQTGNGQGTACTVQHWAEHVHILHNVHPITSLASKQQRLLYIAVIARFAPPVLARQDSDPVHSEMTGSDPKCTSFPQTKFLINFTKSL